jgi:hypothetical protein
VSYVYVRSEPGLWTVGFYAPDGSWEPESDHQAHFLNGGSRDEVTAELAALVLRVDGQEGVLENGNLDTRSAHALLDRVGWPS